MEKFCNSEQPSPSLINCAINKSRPDIRKNRFVRVLSTARITIIFFLASICATPSTAETLIIPGSGNPEYLLGVLAKAFNSQQQEHTIIVPRTTGTAGALLAIAEGHTSMGRVGRPLKENERKLGLTFRSLGRDPIVFVAGAGVTVRNITGDQAFGIFSGKFTNWQELGGKAATIRAIGRESTDASYGAITHSFMNFEGLKFADSVKIVHLDYQLLELLDRFPGSFGFLNRSALSAAKTKLNLLSLDSVEANAENLASERYPLWIEFGLVYKEEKLTEAARSFLKFLDTPSGRQILSANGLVSTLAK